MQQRGWICSSSQGQCRALAQRRLHWAELRQCEDAAKGLVEGIEPTAEFVAKKDEALQALCAGQARAHATSDMQQAAAAAHGPDGSNADVYTGGFRYVLTVTGDYSKRFHF
jgi:hypothetical protein